MVPPPSQLKEKKETDHIDECAIRLINSLLVVQGIHWRKWGQGRKRLFILLLVRVMNVMWGRGLSELLPLQISGVWFKVELWCWHTGLSVWGFSIHHVGVFIQSTSTGELIHMTQVSTEPGALALDPFFCQLLFNFHFVDSLFWPADGAAMSSQCVSSGATQHMLPSSPTAPFRCVPEFRQMFVEISGDFLVFF